MALPDVALRPSDRAQAIHDYIDLYVQQIVGDVKRRQSCLLLGPLGAGKTEVMQRAAIQLHESGLVRCVLVNIGADTQLTPQQLWSGMLRALDGSLQIQHLPLTELRARVREWLAHSHKDMVLLLDQVELLERTGDMFAELRAMIQDATAQDDSASQFITVLSSTEALRRDLTDEHSPLHNLLAVTRMDDCAPAVRTTIWRKVLAHLSGEQQYIWLGELDKLCAGDPYQMLRVAQHLNRELTAMLQSSDVDEQMTRLFIEMRANPAQVAPLLRRYGELIENDAGAATVMLDLIRNKPVLAEDAPRASNDSVWTGIFRNNGAGGWIFRSGLTECYFRNEFERHPERVAAVLMRQQKFEEAIQHLAQRTRRSRDMTMALRDVCLAWVRTAKSPSRAWDKATRALSLWFGDEGVRVLRYVSHWQAGTEQAQYVRVRYGVYDVPAEALMEKLARAAYKERTAVPVPGVAMKSVSYFHEPAQPDDCAIFPLKSNGGEYGAVVLSRAAYEAEFEAARNNDHLEAWIALLNDVFNEIASFEQELLSNVDLSSVQRLAQQHREPEETDWVLGMILASITAGFGLQFNRCALLQIASGARLMGRAAVGYRTQAEQECAWLGNIPATFESWLEQYPPGSDLADTPLGQHIRTVCLEDWQGDSVLGLVLSTDKINPWPVAEIARSALRELMHIEGSTHGDQTVFIVPLRDAGALIGVLVLDRPFTREAVTQEQLDLLPGFANQIALTLNNERIQRDFRLFDALNAATHRRLALQDTLAAVRDVLFEFLSDRMSQLVISLWERSADPTPFDPDRRQSTVRMAHSAERGDLLDGNWQYFFYRSDERCVGPIDQALFTAHGRLHICDLPRWLEINAPDAGPDFTEGIRTVYSVAMISGLGEPQGVISFQSARVNAFTADDIQLLERLATRISNMVDKARVYVGLSNARFHTDQLNMTLEKLMKPNTVADLRRQIVEQVSDFFFGDGRIVQHDVRPDSAALFVIDRGKLANCVAGDQPELAEQLAWECHAMRERAVAGQQVFIEHVSRELVAQEAFGEEACSCHASLGAHASVWCNVGVDLLLVLAWRHPRRISATERQSLPVLTAIAARTNGVIERDRKLMRERLANSLSLGDYELIEAEYSHQWSKRIRAMRMYAQFALEDLTNNEMPVEEQRGKIEGYLAKIKQFSSEGLERLSFTSKVTKVEELPLRDWLENLVKRWNLLNKDSGIDCEQDLHLPADAMLTTRPAILGWILNELLGNALDAEKRALGQPHPILLRAVFHPQAGEFEIAISNDTRMPRDVLDAVRRGSPVSRPHSSGRGIWIAEGQVRALLAGVLMVPGLQDAHTTFTLILPQRLG